MFDQVWWTKLPAHAGPIGRLANRCLGAVYFGVTTVHIALDTAPGLTLGLHLSAHKPATPLHDAIEDLVDDEARLSWLQSVRHFVVDREQIGMVTLPDHVGVACFGRFRGEPLAGVLDNAGAGGDWAGRVAPEALNRGVPDLKWK
jgi:hypothetical protein